MTSSRRLYSVLGSPMPPPHHLYGSEVCYPDPQPYSTYGEPANFMIHSEAMFGRVRSSWVDETTGMVLVPMGAWFPTSAEARKDLDHRLRLLKEALTNV